ncbi:integrin alpha-M-like, partial [Mustelus asterias]
MQWFLVLLLCLCWEIQSYESFNIELEGGTFFNGSQDSHFGQRVAQLQSNKRNWIIVSAPLEKNQTGTRTGIIYRCLYATESCQPLSVVAPDECGAISLGLSLSARTHSQPSVLACGPTFSHQCGHNTYQNGICFLFNGNFQNVARFPSRTQDCFTAKVDLAFLIDGSGSILPDDFTRMKDFVMTMLRRFKLRNVQVESRPSPPSCVRLPRAASVSPGQRPSPPGSVRLPRAASVSPGQRPSPPSCVRLPRAAPSPPGSVRLPRAAS